MEAAGVEPALAGCKFRCAAFTLSPQFEPRKVTLLRLFSFLTAWLYSRPDRLSTPFQIKSDKKIGQGEIGM